MEHVKSEWDVVVMTLSILQKCVMKEREQIQDMDI